MKRTLALAAALTLAACGQSSDNAKTENAGTALPSAQAAETPQPTPEERGRRFFNECAVCHTTQEGAAHRVGPNLFGIVGREAGKAEGFSYSKALGESDLVWTDENLDAYIQNPQGFIPGNRMAYAGQRNAERRADIIAYLKTLKPADEAPAEDAPPTGDGVPSE